MGSVVLNICLEAVRSALRDDKRFSDYLTLILVIPSVFSGAALGGVAGEQLNLYTPIMLLSILMISTLVFVFQFFLWFFLHPMFTSAFYTALAAITVTILVDINWAILWGVVTFVAVYLLTLIAHDQI